MCFSTSIDGLWISGVSNRRIQAQETKPALKGPGTGNRSSTVPAYSWFNALGILSGDLFVGIHF